jgi:NDP-4-keto-2,6-dideoxyhexose 3-C-methyltransferase
MVITSCSMFYDLESPMDFMREIHEVLADDGIWVFEQSYMPAMLEKNSYDTVCHEHLEYYALHQIKWMAERVGFTILDVEFNEVNGGSFSVTVKKDGPEVSQAPLVTKILAQERALGLDGLAIYRAFSNRVSQSRDAIRQFIAKAKREGKSIVGLGASTKGNVVLQYCGLRAQDVAYVGEVNREKFGCYTPGTWIPIIPETNLLEMKPDYLVVLPWHFREFFLGRETYKGFNLVFPLPSLEVLTP